MELFSVLITGANRGIGFELTKQLVNSNKPPKHVFATYRNESTIQELEAIQNSTTSGTKLHLLKLDMLDTDAFKEVHKVIEEVVGDQGLTLLINNAGVCKPLAYPEVTSENLLHHFNSNAVGPILMAQVMLPLLKISASRSQIPRMSFSRAAILNITSLAGSIASSEYVYENFNPPPAYPISKTALNMGMRVLAHTVKDENILVVNLCPGWIKTDMGTQAADLQPQEAIATILETVSNLDETHHGTFIDRLGKPYPW